MDQKPKRKSSKKKHTEASELREKENWKIIYVILQA